VRNTPRGKTTMMHILYENFSYRIKRTTTDEQRIKEKIARSNLTKAIEEYFKE